MQYCGKSKIRRYALLCTKSCANASQQHAIAYPVAKGRILNVATVVMNPALTGTVYEGPWTSKVPKDVVMETYKGWEPAFEGALKVGLPRHDLWLPSLRKLTYLPRM